MAVRQGFRRVTLLLVPRFPFANALTMLMLLGEKAQYDAEPPFPVKMIYAQLALFIICGILMSINIKKKEAALVYAGQIAYFAFTVYSSNHLQYGEWLKNRILIRCIGTIGVCLIFAHIVSKPNTSKQLQKVGETTIAIYIICYTYSLLNSPEDKTAFLKLFPGGEIGLFIIASFMGGTGMSFVSGQFIKDVSQVYAFILIALTVFIDCNINYWTKRRGIEFWLQVRLIVDNICIIIGLFMVWSVYRKNVSMFSAENEDKGTKKKD